MPRSKCMVCGKPGRRLCKGCKGVRDEFRAIMVRAALNFGLLFDARAREEDLPSIDDFIGSDPEFTGAMSTEEYLRSISKV